MKHSWLLALVGLIGFTTLVDAQQRRQQAASARVDVEVRRWRPSLFSDWRFGSSGDPIDPVEDLGLESEQGFDVHATVAVARRLKLRLGRVNFKLDTEAPADRPIDFAGVSIESGEIVRTRADIVQLSGGVEFDLVQGRDGFFAIVADYAQFTAEPEIELVDDRTTAKPDKLDIRLPVLGLRGRVYLTPVLWAGFEAIGMKRETEGVYTDFTAAVAYGLTYNIFVTYGYRNLYTRDKSIEPIGDRATFRLSGNYVGVSIRF